MRKILLMVVMFSSLLSASPIHWEKDLKVAITKATKLKKPILFISSRHTCKYCVILERTTLSNPKIINELNRNFVSVVSYSDDGDYLPKDLWRPGTPAIWFLDAHGEPLFQPIMGAIDSDNFEKAMQVVKKEFIKRLKEEARYGTPTPKTEASPTPTPRESNISH